MEKIEKQEEVNHVTTKMNNKPPSTGDEPETIYRGVKTMPFIIGKETFEKLGAIGTLANLLVYLTTVFNMKRNETFEKLGAIGTLANLLVYLTTVFNMKSITATTLINVFNGTTNFATLLGAFLCDTYFGRYVTLAFATFASFLGLLVIALTATFKALHPPHCTSQDISDCTGATPGQMAFLLTGFALLVIGAGGIRPCNLAFGADQFNPKTEAGKRGINSFFNWYYFTLTFAVMVSLTVIVYVQSNVSWAIGLGIPTLFMLISFGLFFLGTNLYVKVKPEGSPFTSILQVIVVAIKKRRLVLSEKPRAGLFNYMPPNSIISELPHTEQFRFLDKAAIVTPGDQINQDGSSSDPWKLCSLQQIEQVKCVLRVLPIWASSIIYYLAIIQQQTYVVFQALQSDRRFFGSKFQIPAGSYPVFSMLGLTLFIPFYDRILVPTLRRVTHREGGITLLQRMGIGAALSVAASVVSGIVENQRRTLALTKPTLGVAPQRGGISSMQGLWLVPQLSIAGLAEAFMAIGQIEFYYKQFPENMRSVAGSFLFCGMAASSYISGFLVSIVHKLTQKSDRRNWLSEDLNEGRLDYFYYLVATLGAINFVYFLVCSKWYRYKGDKESLLNVEMEKKQEVEKALV